MMMFKLESGNRLMDRRQARESAVDHVEPRQRSDRLPNWPSRGATFSIPATCYSALNRDGPYSAK
jgi:hypothetical protein